MGLDEYWAKRDFRRTPEPKGKVAKRARRRFVCQEHHASSLHFDFRLEIGGVLKSWSVRKGPSMDPKVRRLAVPTEDHPVEYLGFEGDIPEGNYGAGQHRIWDAGEYEWLEGDGGDAEERFERGKLKFELKGGKLKGAFNLFRLGQRDQWLLVKAKDRHADADWKLELLIADEDGNKYIEEGAAPKKRAAAKKPHEEVVRKSARPGKGERLPTLANVLKAKHIEGDRRVKAGEYALDLTSLDRVYWPEDGYTKADLLRYYNSAARYILPYLKDRPLILKRYPNGVKGKSFHQHDVDEVPEFVRTEALEAENAEGAHLVDYVVGGNLATHLYLANLGAIERHPWHSRVGNLDRPDWFVFDLDPGDEVEFATICEVAVVARDVLKDLGLGSYAKTSGSRGIHIYVPIRAEHAYEQVADAAARVARLIADERPDAATVERSKRKRKPGQIYVDHMQNAYGKSVVAPYSVRPRDGATVSAPLEWAEVRRKKIKIEDFNIRTIVDRVKKKGDLFAPVLKKPQRLDDALRRLG